MNERLIFTGFRILALAAGLLANPDRPLPFGLCGFKYLTGWDCPLCGLTRSVCHALHGHWAQSWAYHPAGILVAAALVGSLAFPAATFISRKDAKNAKKT